MTQPRLLDLFGGAGGAAVGYARAGFDVTGVDLLPHPDYPFELIVADALDVVRGRAGIDLDDYDLVHASPPCPRFSTITPAHTRHDHPDLIAPVRAALRRWGGLYVIENVPGAPLEYPVQLCGSSFGLRVRRHRWFESNAMLLAPACAHGRRAPVGVYGDHPDRPGGWARPDGSSRGVKARSVADAGHALGIDWMTDWDDLADAVPPDYCELIGAQILGQLSGRGAAPGGDEGVVGAVGAVPVRLDQPGRGAAPEEAGEILAGDVVSHAGEAHGRRLECGELLGECGDAFGSGVGHGGVPPVGSRSLTASE